MSKLIFQHWLGNTQVATELISSNAPINEKDRTGNQPLVQAVSRKRVEIVRTLLARPDCDVNAVGSTRDTPLMLAVQGEDSSSPGGPILDLLLSSDKIEIDKSKGLFSVNNKHHPPPPNTTSIFLEISEYFARKTWIQTRNLQF